MRISNTCLLSRFHYAFNSKFQKWLVQPSVAAPFRHDLYNDRDLLPLTRNRTHILDLTKRVVTSGSLVIEGELDPPVATCGTLEPVQILMSKRRLPTSVNNYSSRPYLRLNPIDWASLSFLEHQKAWQHHVRYTILPGNISTNLEGKGGVSICLQGSEPPCLWGRAGVWEVGRLGLHSWHVSLRTWNGEWQDHLLSSTWVAEWYRWWTDITSLPSLVRQRRPSYRMPQTRPLWNVRS